MKQEYKITVTQKGDVGNMVIHGASNDVDDAIGFAKMVVNMFAETNVEIHGLWSNETKINKED